MNAKGYKALMAYGLAAAMFSDPLMNRGQSREYEPKPSPEPPIPRGCKKYTIDGITVVAISEKHAIKKVAKRMKGDTVRLDVSKLEDKQCTN